ncbi:hypothetical protein [Alkalibacillus silvisoli]|uniref:DUF91 domain-containing protein n=1 Tax=Alkalibacillus silvisoli TaxID=392823 RepID=A0ABN0ZN92_9BACI
MKRNAEEMIEEISEFLVTYLKSGVVGINSFLNKTDLNISNMEQLLKVHFLLRDEVKQFVRDLPMLIRRFKTSTKVTQNTYHGEIRGQINWPGTIKERLRSNAKDKTIYSVNERDREFAIKENLVLLELLQVMNRLLFREIDSQYYMKYSWFKEWDTLKNTVRHTLQKNIYLSRVVQKQKPVTDRMILDTMKHRNPLYRQAAYILQQYRKVMSGDVDEAEVQELLKETFVFPQEEDVLFELYCVIKLIQHNSEHAEFQIMDGRQNMVAQWKDDQYVYKIYHDSIGSGHLQFNISIDEVKQVSHPFIDRKLESMEEANQVAEKLFGLSSDQTSYWSGRPDIIVEVFEQETGDLRKVIIGEVKYTNQVRYMVTGLRELIDYIKLAKVDNERYLSNSSIIVEGVLFTDYANLNNEARESGLTIDLGEAGYNKNVSHVSFNR